MKKQFYENYWQIRGQSGMRPRYQIFTDWIEPGSKIFDLGCGDGYLGQFLIESRKVDYLGADISDEAVKLARSRGLKTIQLDIDAGLNQFDDKCFDYVIMSEFLEHVVRSEKILKEAGRIARRGILISLPNVAYWKFRLQFLFGRFPKQWQFAPWEHLRFWSVIDFKKTARALGLEVKKVKASNGRPVLRHLWPNLFGFQVCFYLTPK